MRWVGVGLGESGAVFVVDAVDVFRVCRDVVVANPSFGSAEGEVLLGRLGLSYFKLEVGELAELTLFVAVDGEESVAVVLPFLFRNAAEDAGVGVNVESIATTPRSSYRPDTMRIVFEELTVRAEDDVDRDVVLDLITEAMGGEGLVVLADFGVDVVPGFADAALEETTEHAPVFAAVFVATFASFLGVSRELVIDFQIGVDLEVLGSTSVAKRIRITPAGLRGIHENIEHVFLHLSAPITIRTLYQELR